MDLRSIVLGAACMVASATAAHAQDDVSARQLEAMARLAPLAQCHHPHGVFACCGDDPGPSGAEFSGGDALRA